MKAAQRIEWLAWWQLLRVANVFTAASNVIAGFLLVQRDWQPIVPLLLLVFASMLLYEAGMVLNDVCDAKLDAVERPERPIPSGRVSKQNALRVGIALLVGGVLTAHVVSWLTNQWLTAQLSVAIAATIVGYNVGVKMTHFGPWAMGGCRMMNVILGASLAAELTVGWAGAQLLALGVFFHTYGLTHIARHEVDFAHKAELFGGSAAIIMGIVFLSVLPVLFDDMGISLAAWIIICLLLLSVEILLIYRLVNNPSQNVVKQTVGKLIMLFIPIDAAACALAVGWPAGLAVLSLLVPMRLIARWTPMT